MLCETRRSLASHLGMTAPAVTRKLQRKRCMRHHMYLYVCGAILGISGITGMVYWFSIYEILAHELMIIVIAGWCFSIIGILSGGYICTKEKSFKSCRLLLVFIAQLFSAYYLGFLTIA